MSMIVYGEPGKRTTRAKKAGLQFSVARIHKKMKETFLQKRFTAGAPVFMAAVLEYLVAEVLEITGIQTRDLAKSRITARHITLAVRNDEEIDILFDKVTIAEGGVLPRIQPELLKKGRSSSKSHGAYKVETLV
ncbi:hypothetical protein VKT23_013266 [Stygiomarasmius scandens]|uniref:Histone H2A n=1 Tax=Marasmiellus scandens TaxID=2682957 RepID=A0ABR1J7X6_9AGAR